MREKEKIEEIEALAGGLAHEMNTPLFTAIGTVQLILDEIEVENPIYIDLKTTLRNRPNYFEVHLGLTYTFAGIPLEPTLGAGYDYSPDYFGEDGSGNYVNGTLELSLPYNSQLVL